MQRATNIHLRRLDLTRRAIGRPWMDWKPKKAMIKYSHQKSQILVPE